MQFGIDKLMILASLANRRLHTVPTFKEISIPVPWGKIAGKWWGSTKIKPIICLHGIQDNCGSFERLIPILNEKQDISYLCLDFPGHGFSSPFPKGMFYDFLSYPIVIQRISNYFKWSTISLMGHSFGAMVSFVYTLLYPEKVNFIISIDALKPIHNPVSAELMRISIDNFLRYENYRSLEEPMTYTLKEITQKITNRNSINYKYAPLILERNIAVSKIYLEKYYFTRDPKLKLRIMFNWPQVQLVKDANRISCPIFICKAKQASYFEPEKNFYEVLDVLKQSSVDFNYHVLEGTHHLHLNEPEEIGCLIRHFISKHYKRETTHDNSSIFCESHPT